MTYDAPPAKLSVDLRTTFEIAGVRVTSPDLVATLAPAFEKTGHGFALTGYAKRTERTSTHEATTENVRIVNAVTGGYELPRTIVSDTSAGGRTNRVAFTLGDVRVDAAR